ncbi:DUF2800 domain-containing protein [Ruminiclostridium cellobioparum]|uniref:DUF2800 domain-containing protein n=1 Tax=Ruminiclostridium cellobioparum TaxID=29355 RepID=UPI0004866049|nr:DUF2800 domain-containing protein [Ruminiclostridium cellobioparum]
MGHSERAHALLSASGSKRWMNCPPSPRLEEQFPESKSEDAILGTFAHELAEHLLRGNLTTELKPSIYKKKLIEFQKNPLYSQSMLEYIEQYKTIVGEKYLTLKKDCKDAFILLEQELNYSSWAQDGSGTADVVLISEGVIEIVDLKYGQGVPVSAVGNPQMRLYALGAINEYSMLYDFDKVRMTIIQPRLDSVSEDEITVQELLEWGETEVKPVAALAFAGEGEYKSGDHCQFCRAKAVCRKRAEDNLEMARYEFQNPNILTHDEIAVILEQADALQKWAKDIQEYALDQAENHGVKFPGWKLVEGRSNRKYTDKEAVATKLKEEGYSTEVIYQPQEIWGITDMEKKIGKKLFADYLKDLVIKPAGKATLAKESDPRPELSSVASAVKDFDDDILS